MKPKLLYVDDEEMNIEVFQFLFNNTFDVYSAIDGPNGLDVLEKVEGIDIIISDMKMPVMSGLEFIAKAKEQYTGKKYYILSGFDDTPEIKQAIEEGLIHGSFSKPLDVEEISNKVLED